jgi:hypothetical protein
VYSNIRKRCNNPATHNYNRYGGRGIKCLFKTREEFIDYVIKELQIDPRNLTIDRIDNDKHYEPGNIQFITLRENSLKRWRTK